MTPNITEEQRKSIELASTDYTNKEIGAFKYLGSIAAREQWHQTYKDFEAGYTAAFHQKDEQIKRLRQGLENVRRACSSCGDDPVFSDSVIKDIDSIAEETLEINK